jgi:hypothetical protein
LTLTHLIPKLTGGSAGRPLPSYGAWGSVGTTVLQIGPWATPAPRQQVSHPCSMVCLLVSDPALRVVTSGAVCVRFPAGAHPRRYSVNTAIIVISVTPPSLLEISKVAILTHPASLLRFPPQHSASGRIFNLFLCFSVLSTALSLAPGTEYVLSNMGITALVLRSTQPTPL